ncbi:hypothetical protein SUGI_0636310 [Cryptomeria japonica]|uniref:protein LURP-one-related 6 n=1 Tax=Cryptomeria japonica TaxID=3369 RepID=UPI002414A4D2|nr:protein LURP-one-related 6 [Cryptomeria japonica]GLJ31667.1 hypothetical protein SUGI_0636310 [Cryptomeria japonica]
MTQSSAIMRPVVSKKFCSTSHKVFTVRKRPCTINGGGFVVMDSHQGNEVFRVDGCGPAVKDHALLKDSKGNHILSLKRKVGILQVFSLGEQWKGFVPDEMEGLMKPLFKASSSSPINCFANNSVKVSLIESNNSGKGWEFEILGSFSERACTIYDKSQAIVAEVSMNKTRKDSIQSKDVYSVEVQAGFDQAFVFGLIAVLRNLSGEDGN